MTSKEELRRQQLELYGVWEPRPKKKLKKPTEAEIQEAARRLEREKE